MKLKEPATTQGQKGYRAQGAVALIRFMPGYRLTPVKRQRDAAGKIECREIAREAAMNFKKQISRRSILKGAVAAAGAGPLLISGLNAAYAKVPKQSVSYRETPNAGKSCDICANFVAPSSCKLVEGSISPNGWCGLFKPKD
jgi:hypothetical protein